MKIFVAGATGAIGTQLLPRLAAAGHEVVGMTRSAAKCDAIRALGGTPVVADALVAEQVAGAIAEARPDAIVHELTAIPSSLDMRHFDRDFDLTNRLRTEGTNHLLSAGRAVGVRRFVAQSYAGWPFARSGSLVKTEEDPLDPTPVRGMQRTHEAIRLLEATVLEAASMEGIVLRYGALYGPGTSFASGGGQLELIRKRRFPVIGTGDGVWSFVHVKDAASATVAAVDQGGRGIYNIVDDDPAPVREWLPALMAEMGAGRPRHLPRWLGRVVAGEAAVVMLTEVRGAANAKAKRALNWQPAHQSWRAGFARELA